MAHRPLRMQSAPLVAQRAHPAPLALPPLPARVKTPDGQVIEPREDVWYLRKRRDGGDQMELDWLAIRCFTPAALHLSKLIIALRIPGRAPMTTRNDFQTLRRLGIWYEMHAGVGNAPFGWDVLEVILGRAFLAHGMTTGEAGNDFARVRGIYRYGVEALRHPHFSTEVLLALETVRAPGNAKGTDARGGDPDKGELSLDEVDAILDAIAQQAGQREDRILVWLCLELGRNSLQYTLIRNSDLMQVEDTETGDRLYQVAIRRIKKRRAVDEKRTWPISAALGDALWTMRRGEPGDPLLWWLSPEHPEGDMGTRLKRFATEADLRSQRTAGGRLHLNPRRFRVTTLTRAADEGASAEKLAELADHSDLQNVMVYIDNSPSYVARLGEKIDAYYNPAVKRFRGQVGAPNESEGLMIPGFSPHLPRLDLGGIGKCGAKQICGLAPPLTCYKCDKFFAFRDGPHQEVVAALEKSMEQMEPRVALQLASPLAAARDLVRQIKEDEVVPGADDRAEDAGWV